MIEIIGNGTPFTDFVSVSMTDSITNLANEFEFTASAVNGFPPFKIDDSIQILVNGEIKLTGTIETIEGRESDNDHSVTYSGRDNTADLIDSDINDLGDINSDITLKRLIELIISHIGSSLTVKDNLNPAKFNLAEDIIMPQVGDNAFDLIMGYARKRQALLTSDSDSNIVITQSQPTDSGAIVRSVTGQKNNILTQEWDITKADRFNKYVARGQQNPQALNLTGFGSIESLENQSGVSTDNEVRIGRQKIMVKGEGYSDSQLKNIAEWSKQLDKAKGTSFRCSVKGHDFNGYIWQTNTLVQIDSESADITRKMLLNTVTFNQEEGGGATSSLEFVEKDVYTIDNKIRSQKTAGKQNDVFI